MPEEAGFQGELQLALEKKSQYLEAKSLPLLKDSFRLFQTLFGNLYNILLRKSLIQEDPYQYDRKISEVSVPSRDNFLESEKLEKLSQRLAEFQAQLDVLNNYYQFSLEFLNLGRLKRVSGLVQYLDWGNLSTVSADVNTAALAEALGRIKLSADSISAGIIGDSLSQLQAVSRQVLSLLKEVIFYQREAYKLELRRQVFGRLGALLPKVARANPDEAVGKVQKGFRQAMGDKPFYRELVHEALEEEFSETSARLQAEALARLAIPEQQPAEPANKPDYNSILLEAVRLLIPVETALKEAARKLAANQELLDKRRLRFGARFRAWLSRVFKAAAASTVMEIRLFESATGTTRIQALDFPDFMEQVRRKAALFAALASSVSAASARLKAASEEQIFEFLTKNLGELQLIYRYLEGLDGHFKSCASKQERGEIKGIKIELAAVKNSIIRSNKRRYEYVSLKEEQKQRQKMGLA